MRVVASPGASAGDASPPVPSSGAVASGSSTAGATSTRRASVAGSSAVRVRRSRASAAVASAGRSSGSRAARAATSSSTSTGSHDAVSDGAGTSEFTCWKAIWIGVSPVNGCAPVSISYSRTPAAYTSVRASLEPLTTSSGARYATVPNTVPVVVDVTSVTARARPKSATLMRPSAAMSTFSGLTSRCTSPARCAAASASSTRSATSSASPTVRDPRSARWRRRLTPSTYSIVRYDVSPSTPWSYTPTRPGWVSRAAARASRRNRATKSAPAAPSARCGCMTLSATSRSSRRSTARYTVAMPPRAMRCTTS